MVELVADQSVNLLVPIAHGDGKRFYVKHCWWPISVHEDASDKCTCPSCNGQLSKPILRHDHPASLVPLPKQTVPSRGWGEDFWVQVTERSGSLLKGLVDNPLLEARLHGLHQGDVLVFHQDHILAIHGSHRQQLVAEMNPADLKELTQWLGSLRQ